VPTPATFSRFKDLVSERYSLDRLDVDELVIFYKDGDDRISIYGDQDYSQALLLVGKELAKNKNFVFQINLEVSEKSRLFLRELESSKVCNKSFTMDEDLAKQEKEMQEKIKQEIAEKEKLLKELLEKEEEDRKRTQEAEKEKMMALIKKKESEVKERREREEKERAVREEQERLYREEEERVAREEVERRNADKQEQLEKENQLNEEKERIHRENLKESISKSVSDIVNANIEKLREQLIERTILETSRAVEKSLQKPNVEYKHNSSVHTHVRCDGCGVFPIVGVRFKCLECPDFDYCEKCEETLGDSHGHVLAKHRIPVDRNHFRGYRGQRHCQRKWQRDDKEKCDEDKNFGPEPTFIKFLKDKMSHVKEMFCTKDLEKCNFFKNLENVNIDIVLPNETNKEEEVLVKDDIAVEEITSNVDKVVQEVTEEEKNKYRNQLFDLRGNFFFGDITDDQILIALAKVKGNADEALALLFI